MKLIIATNNQNKIIEIQNKFSEITDLELLPLNKIENPPHVIEDGMTFEENAYKKASQISEYANLPALADDSGLVVDILNGKPGVFSARYGGVRATDTDRNTLLLNELKDIPLEKRNARFVCVISIVLPNKKNYTARGECEGFIADSMKGTYGFGYDPIFYIPEFNKTMAELTLLEKNRISHRAKALDKARDILRHIN